MIDFETDSSLNLPEFFEQIFFLLYQKKVMPRNYFTNNFQ